MKIKYLSEEEALVVLLNHAKESTKKIRKVLDYFGSAKTLLEESKNLQLAGLEKWQDQSLWQEDLEAIEKESIKIISFQSPLFPRSLLQIDDPPLLIYCKGNIEARDQKGVSIVGTRAASFYGLEMAEKISGELSIQGFSIISGLARGIDTKAHLAAIEFGRTLAFIGSGLSHIYPKENEWLVEKICENGACISEVPMHTKPKRYLFPKRNRLVSAMGQASLLIEAPLKSGAMITMELAKKQGKNTFAIPGRIDVPSFAGNHDLIKNKNAELIESSVDIVKALGRSQEDNSAYKEKKDQHFFLPLNEEEEHLLNLMPVEEIQIEEIAARCEFAIFRLNALLSSLVIKNYIKEHPGKIFKKSRSV